MQSFQLHESSLQKDFSIVPATIKLDSTRLPLVPQPSSSEMDPLNYPNVKSIIHSPLQSSLTWIKWLKCLILIEVSILAFLATLNVAIINPAVALLAKEFSITEVTATYQTTIAIGTSAIGPLIFVPIANVYGRRPVYLFTLFIGFASAIGSATAKSYGTLILARAFNGSGAATASVLGAGTFSDMFFMHQRGKVMGLYTLMSTNGAHLAPIVWRFIPQETPCSFLIRLVAMWPEVEAGSGAFGLAQYSMVIRWFFCVPAYLIFWNLRIGIMLVICLFFLPETLYTRPPGSYDQILIDMTNTSDRIDTDKLPEQGEVYQPPSMRFRSYIRRLGFWNISPDRHLRRNFLVKPFSMLKYPSVIFPAAF